MRRCLIICLMLLSACGDHPPAEIEALQALDLSQCPGWQGPVPAVEAQMARASAAEMAGRLCANAKLSAARETVDKLLKR